MLLHDSPALHAKIDALRARLEDAMLSAAPTQEILSLSRELDALVNRVMMPRLQHRCAPAPRTRRSAIASKAHRDA